MATSRASCASREHSDAAGAWSPGPAAGERAPQRARRAGRAPAEAGEGLAGAPTGPPGRGPAGGGPGCFSEGFLNAGERDKPSGEKARFIRVVDPVCAAANDRIGALALPAEPTARLAALREPVAVRTELLRQLEALVPPRGGVHEIKYEGFVAAVRATWSRPSRGQRSPSRSATGPPPRSSRPTSPSARRRTRPTSSSSAPAKRSSAPSWPARRDGGVGSGGSGPRGCAVTGSKVKTTGRAGVPCSTEPPPRRPAPRQPPGPAGRRWRGCPTAGCRPRWPAPFRCGR